MAKQIVVQAVVREINPNFAQDIVRVNLYCPPIAAQVQPGHSVTIEPGVDSSTLRRPLTVHEADGQVVTLIFQVVGPNTRQYAKWQPGDKVSIFGPIGQPVVIDPRVKCFILVAGGVGLASLSPFLVREIQQGTEARIILVAGFKSHTHVFGLQDFEVLGVETHSIIDDEGTAVDLFQRVLSSNGLPDRSEIQVFTCGPEVMMRQVAKLSRDEGLACSVFLERMIGCGTGVCLGCAVRVNTDEFPKHLCQDGPIFKGQEVDWDAKH